MRYTSRVFGQVKMLYIPPDRAGEDDKVQQYHFRPPGEIQEIARYATRNKHDDAPVSLAGMIRYYRPQFTHLWRVQDNPFLPDVFSLL